MIDKIEELQEGLIKSREVLVRSGARKYQLLSTLSELYSEWDGKNLGIEQEIQEVEGELEIMGVEI